MQTYYIVRRKDAPPAITESWRAAEYWQRKGCVVDIIELPALSMELG